MAPTAAIDAEQKMSQTRCCGNSGVTLQPETRVSEAHLQLVVRWWLHSSSRAAAQMHVLVKQDCLPVPKAVRWDLRCHNQDRPGEEADLIQIRSTQLLYLVGCRSNRCAICS